jgi:hypothetical protein
MIFIVVRSQDFANLILPIEFLALSHRVFALEKHGK